MREIKVVSKDRDYSIYIERNIINAVGRYIKQEFKSRKVVVITDQNVGGFYGEIFVRHIEESGFNVRTVSINPGEKGKTLSTLESVYKELVEFKLNRSDLIITLGGGVVGDLGGFAASTYLRGVPYIQVPTTLLAQVDSSIGGKVAVDLPQGKNLVGSFYNPEAVFIDPELLKTLNKRFLHDGLAEIIKYGCIKDKKIIDELFKFKDDKELLENMEGIIESCCNIKKTLVETDEKDYGERMLLNFGHTIGHAVEKYFDYDKYTHGEAVGIGMVHITEKSEEFGLTEKNTSAMIKNVLKKYNLPVEMPIVEREKLMDTIMLDKKNTGDSINMIILKKLGEAYIKQVNTNEISLYI